MPLYHILFRPNPSFWARFTFSVQSEHVVGKTVNSETWEDSANYINLKT